MNQSAIRPATAERPCPVCAGTHKCGSTADGLVLCGRKTDRQPGFRHLGGADDPTWQLYRPEGNGPPPQSAVRTPPAMLPGLAFAFGRHLTPDRAAELAQRLRLPTAAVRLVPNLGFDPGRGCWTIPETDAGGHVVGIAVRYPDGSKKAVPGSRRGLVVPAGFHDLGGPVVVVEGMSDAVALAYCALAAVGRPSARGGAEMLVGLLRGVAADRPILVLAENDVKPDGKWPGREGAEAVAAALTHALKRRVLIAAPPDQYKDARDWIADRLPAGASADQAAEVGADIAGQLSRVAAAALALPPAPRAGRHNALQVASAVAAGRLDDGAAWVWDGFLFRGGVTLLSALPKAGKTTLLSHLLKGVGTGGGFCGRPLVPGRAVVVSEESPEVWAGRIRRLGLGDHVRFDTRPFFGRPSADDWASYLVHLDACLAADPADLVIFDTLANLWPVKDENSANDIGAALQPVLQLAKGRAVLLVHHLRKSDGGEGTGSRGSGALAGFADVLVELRRAGRAADPGGAKRVLTAVGRVPGVPPEWTVEWDETADTYRAANPAGEGTADRLRDAIGGALAAAGEAGRTFKGLMDDLPDELRRNHTRVRDAVAFGVERGEWTKEPRATTLGGPIYRAIPEPATELATEPDGGDEVELPVTTSGELFASWQGLPD